MIPALGHDYKDGKCSRCGAEEPTTPVEPGKPQQPEKPTTPDTPATGDESSADAVGERYAGVRSGCRSDAAAQEGKLISRFSRYLSISFL